MYVRDPDRSKQILGIGLWKRRQPSTLEHCFLLRESRCYSINGRILTVLENQPTYIEYRICWADDWSASILGLTMHHGLNRREIHLERDLSCTWKRDGVIVPDLQGIMDPDLEVTPATNTLPIRRLDLKVGESAEVDAAWVGFPSLSVQRLPQRYTRTSDREYRYESGGGAFSADLSIDSEGLVLSYGNLWEPANP